MTLVLTELSPFGIAMAADSAVTTTQVQTGLSYAVPNAAHKLQAIERLSAGVSCWGLGTIRGTPTDEWLCDFIRATEGVTTLGEFADELERRLNDEVGANPRGQPRLGFHVCRFEDYEGCPTPSFYHVHDGPSTALQARGTPVDPHRFNANHDCPPQMCRALFEDRQFYTTRNGDYQLYAGMFGLLGGFFAHLRELGIQIPSSQSLADRAEYLIFQIRVMCELYRLSNLVPGIGGGIHFLTIASAGIHSRGVRYLW